MVRRLVEDMIRRTPIWLGAVPSSMVAFGWGVLNSKGHRPAAMAMSLVFTYAIGPFAMTGRLQTPLIPYLPVSRREVWRAAWLMSTVAPAAVMTALEIPA